jgi:hypothetical protein
LQAPYFSEITASIDFLLRLKRDLTLKCESHTYSWKAWKPESLEAENIFLPSSLPAYKLPSLRAFRLTFPQKIIKGGPHD